MLSTIRDREGKKQDGGDLKFFCLSLFGSFLPYTEGES